MQGKSELPLNEAIKCVIRHTSMALVAPLNVPFSKMVSLFPIRILLSCNDYFVHKKCALGKDERNKERFKRYR